MFSLTSSHKYFLYSHRTDMRKSFDGLCSLVTFQMSRYPTSGEVFIFIGTRKDAIKLLHWENGGFVLYCKRLEKWVFDAGKTVDQCSALAISRAGDKGRKVPQKDRFQAR